MLAKEELGLLEKELKNIYRQIAEGKFVLTDGVEDIHSQVELMLTEKLGDFGKRDTQRPQPQRPGAA